MFRCSLLLLCFATACFPKLLHHENAFLTEEQSRELSEYRNEVEIGRNIAGRLFEYYGNYQDENLVRYLHKVGVYLSQFSNNKQRRYKFGILNTKHSLSFACPGDYILISVGILESMKNEAELAMLLSHEIAHVEEKHMLTQLRDLKFEKKAIDIDPILQTRRRMESLRSSDEDIQDYILGSNTSLVSLNIAWKAGFKILFKDGWNPHLESEAEEIGLQIAIRAGYNPHALQTFLQRLKQYPDPFDSKIYETTHGNLGKRLSLLEHLLEKTPSHFQGAFVETRFQNNTENLRE